jgi:putative endonuclease
MGRRSERQWGDARNDNGLTQQSDTLPVPAMTGMPRFGCTIDHPTLRRVRNETYYVYILSNRYKTVYVGMTNDIYRRLAEHRAKIASSFTRRYAITKLVHVEATSDVRVAIAREKQIKSWTRGKKIALIRSQNPGWEDLETVVGAGLSYRTK